MKKLYKYIVLVFGILAFSACTDEIVFPNVVEEGTDVTLKLNVKAHAKNNVTVGRAAEDEMLYDLHFYVFDQYGNLTGHTPVTGTSLTSPNGSVSITAKTGKSYIYAVANINVGVYYTISDADKKLLNNPDGDTKLTLTKLKEIKFNRTISQGNNLLSPTPEDKFYLMSGYMNDGNPVVIQQEGVFNESGEKINIVYLYRILAKNTLKIKTYSTEKDEYETDENGNYVRDDKGNPIKKKAYRGKFTPKSYRLCNVPKSGVLIPNTNIGTTSQYLKKTEEDGTVTDNITLDDVESSYFENSLDSTFIFYYPENLQIAKSEEEVRACQTQITQESDRVTYKEKKDWVWKDRETNKWISNDNGNIEKKYIFADDNAAYIEIEGTYEYEGEYQDENGVTKNEKLNASVTYTIHLGDFATDIQDFNVIRNSNYTYNVIVNGVDDIIAEATKDDNGKSKYDNPYAEGLVIRTTTGEHYDVDAHYEARVMAFNLQELKTLQGQNFGYFLNIETPFDKLEEIVYVKNDGVYSLSNTTTPLCDIHNVESKFSKENLFGWVRFVRNTTDNVTKTGNDIRLYTCKYPGDQWDKTTYDNAPSGTSKPAMPWMNAFELLADLYTQALSSTGIVYYTCFIDENYYANKSWSEFVNQEPRIIQIANTLSESPDGKSIYADAAYSISQHSIATFYRDPSLKAFGTEIIDEEDKYSKAPYNYQNVRMGDMGSTDKYTIFPPSTTRNEYWDGYTSAATTNKDKGWYDHIIGETQLVQNIPNSQPLYGAVGKACMSRNRDLNGDGIITNGDANNNNIIEPEEMEVKWYLASVQQYHALYIAKKSLPAESHLISDTELQAINTAYTTDVYGLPNTWDGVEITNQWGGGTRIQENDPSGHDFRGKFHYYTSSPSNDAGTYWPEEGLTNNGVSESSSFVQRAELVRCVRTLGRGTTNKTEEYEKLVELNGLEKPDLYYKFNENNDYIFNLTGIQTWREAMPTLTYHHELQPLNELSPKFEVARNSLSSSYSLLGLTSEDEDPCTKYEEGGNWRTPNQKEMALMLAQLPSDMKSNRHGVRTRFSAYIDDDNPITQQNPNGVSWHGPYFWHTRYGFSVETSGKFNVTGDNANVYIRCVRDVR